MDDEATHAANVATMTAALAIDAGYPQRVCIDITAAAIVHDVGHLFLPEEMRGVPEPLLDERSKELLREFGRINANDVRQALMPHKGHEG